MKVLYKFLTCALILLGCGALVNNAHAIPAKPGPITVTQPDGSSLTIRIFGDEWASYITTDDGYGIERGDDGFFYYIEKSGRLSSVKAKPASARTAADRAAMSNVKQGVPFGEMEARRAQFMAQNPLMVPSLVPAAAPRTSDRNLVILVQYSDKSFVVSSPDSYFNDFLNGTNFSQNGATGSVRTFYNDNSNGVYTATFDVKGPYTAPNTHSYYSNDYYLETRVPELVRNVLQQMATAGFDFSPYATGSYVDQICLIYCGNNRAEGGTGIHPHQYYVGGRSGSATIGGYTFNKYLVTSELRDAGTTASYAAGIGTFTHEYGHIIGLPDYYDTNYATQNLTPSTYFVMDMGGYNDNGRRPSALSAINRWLLGWIEPEVLDAPGTYTLPYIENSNKTYIIRISGTNGSDVGEYYLLETRSTTLGKWDKGMLAPLYPSITGSAARDGMFVMHIDRRSGTQLNKWNTNSVNDTNGHPNARPVCAVTTSYNSYYGTWTNQNRWVFPGYGNVTTLNSTTHPTFSPWAGTNDHKLTNIAYSNGTVTFDLAIDGVQPPDPIPFTGTVKNASNQNVSGSITLVRQNTATGANSTTRLTPVTSGTFTASVSNGSFSFADVKEEGTYIATVTANNYQTHKSVVNVTTNGSANLVVDTPIQSSYTRKSWASSYNTSVKYTSNGDMIIGAKFDYADFGASGKVNVYGADYQLSSTAGVELQVYDGNNTKLHSVPVSNFISGNSKYVDLTSLNLSLSSGESMVIAYKLTGYSGSYPATMSSSTTNRDKGALIKSSDTAQWSTGDANWMIGVYAGEQKATGVVFDLATMATFVGNFEAIGYSFVPEGTTNTLTWSSSNTNVLTVDNNGTIKCLSPGSATVTASLPGNAGKATCTVTVSSEIEGTIKIEVDNSAKKAVASWTPATNRANWVIQWRPKGGSYTRVETDKSTITFENLVWDTEYQMTLNGERTDGRIWGETAANFKCVKPSATGVTLTKTTLSPFVGDMQALEYKMVPEDGVAALKWESSDTSVLTVDGEGVIKPLKAGKATVTVSSNDFSGNAKCEVTVSSEIDGDIKIEVDNLAKSASVEWKAATTRSKWNYRLVIDGTQSKADQITATEIRLTDLPAGAQGELFISGVRSDSEVWGETRATFQISDKPAAERIDLDETEIAIFMNEEFQLTATVFPENAYNSELEWSSSDESVVTVDQTGLITGTGAGEATVTVKTKVGNISATCGVTVTMEVAPVKAVTVYQNDAEFEWPGSLHEGAFDVEIFAGNTLITKKTVNTAYVYIPLLSPGTTYEIVVTAVREGGNSSTLEFTTEARNGNFASMMIKGSYAADEAVPFRVKNIQGDVASIEWRVDGTVVSDTDMPGKTLGSGRHEIKATITTKTNHKEVITKIVNIQ